MTKESKHVAVTGAAWAALSAGLWVALLQIRTAGEALEATRFSIAPGASLAVLGACALAAAGAAVLLVIHVRQWIDLYRQRRS